MNQTAATTCINNLDSEFCVDWTAGQAGGCEGVCGATTSADAGTGSDAATTGLGTAVGFCNTEGSLLCDRSFECDPAGSATQYGNLAGCKAMLSSLCSSGQPCPNGYNQSSASGCIAATQAASCQALLGSAPAVCTSACP